MSSVKLLLVFFIFTLITQVYSRRLHFEDDASPTTLTSKATEASTPQTAKQITIEANSTSVEQTNANIDEDSKTTTPQTEGKVAKETQKEPIVLNSTTTQTQIKIQNSTTETGAKEIKTTATQTNATQTTIAQSNESTVPLSDLPTLTTKQLTLNLSSLKFPDPKPQGDTLNLSGISITTSSSSSSGLAEGKCKSGYTVSIDGKNCQLADILLQINLDAQNLIVGDLNIEELKAKQIQFKNKHQAFTVINCSSQTPFLSKQGCIACKDPNSLFSLKSLKCSRCPEGATYNTEIKNCESVPGVFVSNINANKFLVLPGESLDDYKKQIEDSQKQNSNIQVCPLDRPYSVGSECVSCPNEKPLFFIASRSCTACQANSTYNANVHSCLGKKYKITTITRTSSKQQQRKKKKQQDSSSSSDDKKKKKEENNQEESKRNDE